MRKKYRLLSNIIIVIMLITLFTFTININSNYVFSYSNPNVVYSGNTNSNKVSLMINVYWGNEYIEPMLEIFDKYNVKATFFVGGSWVVKYPDLLKQIYGKGHEIGNHGYHHKDQDKLGYSQNLDEIKKCHEVVKNFINFDMVLFAPPSGAFNKSTLEVAQELGYQTIMWTKDTIDWRDHDDDLIFKRATQNLKGGDLILCHPTEETLQVLPKILEYFKSKNFIQCTVSNNLKSD